jgi:hypothetical protein
MFCYIIEGEANMNSKSATCVTINVCPFDSAKVCWAIDDPDWMFAWAYCEHGLVLSRHCYRGKL